MQSPVQGATGAAAGAAADRLAEGIDSDLAGLFYLVNLMLRLDLPGCFEPDWALASAVGPWGVLEALGRGLLAATGDAWSGDAVWLALAALDGREPGSLPGEGYPGPSAFRLPLPWLPVTTATWAADARRLRAWSAPDIPLLDLPRSGEPPAAQAAAELRPYLAPDAPAPRRAKRTPRTRPGGPLIAGLGPGLQRWLALVQPSVEYHLRQALALERSADLSAALIQVRGRLYVTSSHLDVVFRLDAISLPVRLAGLDRDPGWQCDFGRVISFHFL